MAPAAHPSLAVAFALMACVFLGSMVKVDAATKYWRGSANGNWSTGANWIGNTPPAAGDDLVFQQGVSWLNVTNDYGASRVFGAIIFEGAGYVVRGPGLALLNGVRAQHASGTNLVFANVELRANQTFTCLNGGTALLLGGDGLDTIINLAGWTLTVDGAGRIDMREGLAGIGGVIKNGPGTLRYLWPNDYTGDTIVNSGLLEMSVASIRTPFWNYINGRLIIGDGIGGPNADVVRLRPWNRIADTSAVFINSSGLLELDDANETIGPLTLNGGRIHTGDGTNVLTLAGDVTVLPNAQTASINGRLSLGTTARMFQVGNGPATRDLEITADIRGLADCIKAGTGLLSLGGSNSFTGLAIVKEGTLQARNNHAFGTTDNPTVVSNNATLSLSYAAVSDESLVLGTPGASPAGFGASVISEIASNCWDGPIRLERTTFVSTYSTLNLSGVVSGPGALTKFGGAGSLWLSGPAHNTYTGTTLVDDGTLVLDKSGGATAVPGTLHLTTGTLAALNLVRFARPAAGNQIADSSTVTNGLHTRFDLAGATETIGSLSGNGTVNLGAGTLTTGANNASTEYAGVISGAAGRFVKVGTGAMILSGNNTHTGATIAQTGTLWVRGNQSASPVTVASGATLGGSGYVGNLTVNGILAPGFNFGRLTSANATFSSSARFDVELGGPPTSTAHDELFTVGSVSLGNAALRVLTTSGYAPRDGEQFVIIRNGGTDPVASTFAGLANGGVVPVNGLNFHVSYTGHDGNDVTLTATNVPLRYLSASITTGNGNGVIDANECNLLYVTLTNVTGAAVTGITADLVPRSPGVSVTAGSSVYPNAPALGRTINTFPFQVTTAPGMTCGVNLDFDLVVRTAAAGTFTVHFRLPTGSPASPRAFNNSNPISIPDGGTVSSLINVSGITAPLAKVEVSLRTAHATPGDLDLYLVAPDGTTVELSTDNGNFANSYGVSCTSRVTFDDSATRSITETMPLNTAYVGRYRPEGPLADFRSKSGLAVNGIWRLVITDDTVGNAGALDCWTLTLWPAQCADGGGPCEMAASRTIRGLISSASAIQPIMIAPDGSPGSCDRTAPSPAWYPNRPGHFDAYTFVNGDSPACVTVSLQAECPLFSAAYTNSFNPAAIGENYLADSGRSTEQNGGAVSYSFQVPAHARFVVSVNELNENAGCDYTLTVSGGSALRPALNIHPVESRKVAVDWTTAALGFKLESHTNLRLPSWAPLPIIPCVVEGRYTVTNATSQPQQFYRLRRP